MRGKGPRFNFGGFEGPYTEVVGGGRGRGKGPRFNFVGFEGPYTKVVGEGRREKVHGSFLGVLKGLTPRWLIDKNF